VLYIAAAPEKTLAELLVERGNDGVGLVLGAGVGERKVGWYVHRGFDMASAINPVSECTGERAAPGVSAGPCEVAATGGHRAGGH
jgi:hypothetical protein